MTFQVETTRYHYDGDHENQVEALKVLGFQFVEEANWRGDTCLKIQNDISIQINTLQELLDFVKQYGHIVFDGETIEIYNDARET